MAFYGLTLGINLFNFYKLLPNSLISLQVNKSKANFTLFSLFQNMHTMLYH